MRKDKTLDPGKLGPGIDIVSRQNEKPVLTADPQAPLLVVDEARRAAADRRQLPEPGLDGASHRIQVVHPTGRTDPHTTVARVLSMPGTASAVSRVRAAAAAAEAELCGLEIDVDELWYVEEADVLALALGGRWDRVPVPFAGTGC